jgi:hypothetical protein
MSAEGTTKPTVIERLEERLEGGVWQTGAQYICELVAVADPPSDALRPAKGCNDSRRM